MSNGMSTEFHATTICAVQRDGKTAIAGDGQVTMGNAVIMKGTAQKVRRLYHGKIISGLPAPLPTLSRSLITLKKN